MQSIPISIDMTSRAQTAFKGAGGQDMSFALPPNLTLPARGDEVALTSGDKVFVFTVVRRRFFFDPTSPRIVITLDVPE